ncbi:tetratricopeptide repeat protein [Streptomyces hebeiensis]
MDATDVVDAAERDLNGRLGRSGQARKTLLAAGLGAVLVGGAALFAPEEGARPERAPSSDVRAVGPGGRSAVQELGALIRDREAHVRAHPEDARAWAVLGSAYVARGAARADSAYFPKAERALRRALDGPRAAGAAGSSGSAGSAGSAGAVGSVGSVDATEKPAGPNGAAERGEDAKPRERGGAGGPAAVPAEALREGLAGLASLAGARHDYATAKRWGETLRARQPRLWTSYAVLVDAYTGLGDHRAAGRALDELTKLRSGAPVLLRTARVFRDRGWREDAEAKADEAAARAGSPAEKAAALRLLGELAWERGEPAVSLAHYDAALATVHDEPAARAGRARALAALGRTAEAYTDYLGALDRLPSPEIMLELGELYDSERLDGDARTQYARLRAQAARARRDGVNEELVLARYEADHGDARSAVRRLRGEWDHGRRSLAVADALGWALYRAGETKEALAYAKRATGQGTRSALYAYHRGEIERALGMRSAARLHLEEALRTNPHFSPLLAPRAREGLRG